MTFVKTIDDALEYIKAQHQALVEKLDDTIPVIQKLQEYPALSDLFRYDRKYVSNTGVYASSYSSYYHTDRESNLTTIESIEQRRDALLAICENEPKRLEEVRQINLSIIEHNKMVKKRVTTFMETVGIKSSYSAIDSKSRARNPKYITKYAGYIEDFHRCIPLEDYAYKNRIDTINRVKVSVTKWSQDAIASIRETEKFQQEQQRANKQSNFLATMRVKYNLAFDADKEEIFRTFMSKCKYLHLADAMLKAREDFSEDYQVEYAISTFSIENDYDRAIYECITSCLEDYEDGRVFRDCEWNYGRIFELVTDDLLKDYNDYYKLF